MKITITPAQSADEIQAVRNMFVAFFYDLSQYDPNMIINDFGLPVYVPPGEPEQPGPRTLDECADFNWWIRGECELILIRADDRLAGYAVVLANRAHLAPEIDFELLDFYIAPKYRRLGIGRQAAHRVLDRHRGTWQVFELERNTPARAFWQRVIGEYTAGHFENLDSGTQQQFKN